LPARYHFDLESRHEVIRDDQGVVADSLEQAVEQAALGVEEMRASGELPAAAGDWFIVIRDETGRELTRIRV
jgi:hypothetical protein